MKTFYIALWSAFTVCFCAVSADATVIQNVSGFSSTGDAISFKSELTIAGDILTIRLFNISPAASNSPDDLFSSYFFDIKNSFNQRPTLVYLSAVGDVYLTDKKNPDVLQAANANLKAVKANDNTWQYLTFNPVLYPNLGFGIGTVGNNKLTPNNFYGNIVGNMDYAIYAGEVTSQSLHNKLFVKPSATFTFSGLTGFTESHITNIGVFGLGSVPESLMFYAAPPSNVPEPATITLLCLGGLVLTRKKRK